jgi:ankyrin repeat protein
MRRLAYILALSMVVVSFGTRASSAGNDARVADAVMRADRDAVRSLIQQKSDVNASQPDGMTALHWAARQNDLETAQMLVRAGAKPDAATRYGVTPLYFACESGSAAMIDLLLRAGVDPNSANLGAETALMTAVRGGKMEAVKLLLDRGASVNAKESVREQTALMWAVTEKHPEIVKLLLGRGADINAHTKVEIPDGTSGKPEAKSGDIGAHGPGFYRGRAVPSPSGGMTALHFAVRDGNSEITRILVDAGAGLENASGNGTRPLLVAIINNHIELAMYLLEKGANPNAADDFHKRTPLFAAIEMRNPDFTRDTAVPVPDTRDPMDLIKALLARGADPNAQVNTTPFRGFYQVSANWVNFDGQTAFVRAALNGDVTLMRLLLEHGADPNIKTYEGTSALMAAAGLNWVVGQTYSRSDAEYLEAASLCLEKGADVNAVNKQGLTAMHGATNRGFNKMVQLLADRGAKLDVKDSQGRTPMTYAEGVFLAVQPPVRKTSTIALLEKLTNSK